MECHFSPSLREVEYIHLLFYKSKIINDHLGTYSRFFVSRYLSFKSTMALSNEISNLFAVLFLAGDI